MVIAVNKLKTRYEGILFSDLVSKTFDLNEIGRAFGYLGYSEKSAWTPTQWKELYDSIQSKWNDEGKVSIFKIKNSKNEDQYYVSDGNHRVKVLQELKSNKEIKTIYHDGVNHHLLTISLEANKAYRRLYNGNINKR